MLQLARELGLPVVTTNDAHYLRKEDAEAHDVLLAIGTGKDLDDPNRFRFFGQESYVKSEREMRVLFPDLRVVREQHAHLPLGLDVALLAEEADAVGIVQVLARPDGEQHGAGFGVLFP